MQLSTCTRSASIIKLHKVVGAVDVAVIKLQTRVQHGDASPCSETRPSIPGSLIPAVGTVIIVTVATILTF